jgi:hypothetical protein
MPRQENQKSRSNGNNKASFNRSYYYDDYAADGNVTSGKLPFEENDEIKFRREAAEKIDEETGVNQDYSQYERFDYNFERYDLHDDFENYPQQRQEKASQGKDHTGKGPKGWKRNDERILEDVNESLYRSHEVDASDIEVKVQNGLVTLTGFVDSRFEKREAELCAEHVNGVHDIQNELQIRS